MAVRASPEASLGFAMAFAVTVIAMNLSTSAGIKRGWNRDRINYVAGWISAITFLISFVAAWLYQPEIASLLAWVRTAIHWG